MLPDTVGETASPTLPVSTDSRTRPLEFSDQPDLHPAHHDGARHYSVATLPRHVRRHPETARRQRELPDLQERTPNDFAHRSASARLVAPVLR